MTILKTSISGYPTYLFANADSGDNDTVRGYLIEYSDDAGKNPLYKSRTIRFALDPDLGAESVGSITSTSAAITFDINPKNSAGTTEVTYSAITPTGVVTGFAKVNPGYTDSPASVTANLTGLIPYTTYSYTITLTNQGGTVSRSGSFSTGNGTPESMALSARDVTKDSAVIGAAVRANGSGLTSLQVAYSTNQNLSSPTTANIDFSGLSGTEAKEATVTITGLTPETTYYFRTTAVNSSGTATSEILSFTTGKDLSTLTQQLSSSSPSAELPNGIEVAANHPKVFPTDFDKSPAQDATYISYTLKNSSSQEIKDLWLTLEDFVGGSVVPLTGQSEQAFVGALAPGQSKTVFFYLKALRETELDQSHVVKVTQGQPGTDLASTSSSIVFTFDAVRSLEKSDSVIRDTRFNTSAPPLGGEFKVTNTGTFDSSLGADEYFLSPAVKSEWPAESLRLENIRLVFPDVTATPSCPSVVINNQLIDNSCYRGQNFEVTYTFRVIDIPTKALELSPSVTSGDGSAWDSSDIAKNPPVTTTLRPQQNLTLKTEVSNSPTSTQVSISGVTYSEVTVTIDIDNTSLRSSSLDQIVIDLDGQTLINTQSAYLEINGARYSISPRVIDSGSNTVAIDGPINAKAGDDVKVVFEALVPEGASQDIEVSGKIGDNLIGPEPGANSTTKVEIDGSGAISASTMVTQIAPRAAAGAATDVFGNSAVLRGKLLDGVDGATLSFRIGQSPDLNFGTWDVSASPAVSSGIDFESFTAELKGLTPGTTYYFKPLYDGVPSGEVMSFTTLAEDKPFVGLSTNPLPQVAICTEAELDCPPTEILPPVVSCGDCSLNYTVSAGALPPGLALDPNTGVISGNPTGTGGNYQFTLTVTAQNSDPNEPAMTASQNYNLVTAPNTAEPTVLSSGAGNISNTSALISANLGYVPNGELVGITVRFLDGNSNWQTVTTEVVGEGGGQQSQLYTLNMLGLSPSSTYSFKVSFGAQEGDWVEFVTPAVATVPLAPAVSETEVNQVDDSTAVISATVSNPIAGDALGFVVGTQQDLSDGRTYISSNASATSEYAVSTQLTSLTPGTYFYRILLGDGLSPLTYPFTIGISQNNSIPSPVVPPATPGVSGGSGSGSTATSSPGTGVEADSESATANQYRYVLKRIPIYFAPGKTALTSAQKREVRLILANLPKARVDTKVTAVGWVAARPVLASDSRISTQRARNVVALVPSGFDAKLRALGKARAKNSSASARRVDLWIGYKVPILSSKD